MDIYISVKRDQDDTHAATRVSDRNDCTILPFGFRLVVDRIRKPRLGTSPELETLINEIGVAFIRSRNRENIINKIITDFCKAIKDDNGNAYFIVDCSDREWLSQMSISDKKDNAITFGQWLINNHMEVQEFKVIGIDKSNDVKTTLIKKLVGNKNLILTLLNAKNLDGDGPSPLSLKCFIKQSNTIFNFIMPMDDLDTIYEHVDSLIDDMRAGIRYKGENEFKDGFHPAAEWVARRSGSNLISISEKYINQYIYDSVDIKQYIDFLLKQDDSDSFDISIEATSLINRILHYKQ